MDAYCTCDRRIQNIDKNCNPKIKKFKLYRLKVSKVLQ